MLEINKLIKSLKNEKIGIYCNSNSEIEKVFKVLNKLNYRNNKGEKYKSTKGFFWMFPLLIYPHDGLIIRYKDCNDGEIFKCNESTIIRKHKFENSIVNDLIKNLHVY